MPLLDSKGKAAADVYMMQYELEDSPGVDGAQIRSALLIIPSLADVSKRAPIIAYAHGGDKGLNYPEIAGILGELQRDHIIIAPTFPGEPFVRMRVF